MRDTAEPGVQLRQEAVCSDRGGECSPIVVGRRGRLAVPARFAQIVLPHLRSSNSFGRCLDRGLRLSSLSPA